MNDRAYELKILQQVIVSYIDKNITVTEEDLNSVISNLDEFVWKLAVKIYSESGYKVEFLVIRDTINSHLEVLKMRLVSQQEAAYKQLQAQKIEEARRKAEEDRQIAEAEARKQNQLIELSQKLEKSGRDQTYSDLFLKVLEIVSEKLSIDDLDRVTLESHISDELGADELDTVELRMALEEAFDIEIPDDLLGSIKKWPPSYNNSFGDYEPIACTVGELLDYIYNYLREQ